MNKLEQGTDTKSEMLKGLTLVPDWIFQVDFSTDVIAMICYICFHTKRGSVDEKYIQQDLLLSDAKYKKALKTLSDLSIIDISDKDVFYFNLPKTLK